MDVKKCMSITKLIIATKHNSRRNEKRTASYWSIEEKLTDENIVKSDGVTLNGNLISDHWMIKNIPNKILLVLDTADDYPNAWALKQSKFIIEVAHELEYDDFGHVNFDNVLSIKKITK